jgi:hypothetical protein
MSDAKEAAKAIAVAVLPTVVAQIGEGIREALKARREQDKSCAHGKPGGRLYARCSP